MNIKRSIFKGNVTEWVNIAGHVGSTLFIKMDFINHTATWCYSPNLKIEKLVVEL